VLLDWASSLGNQGVALILLAERRKDAAVAETALNQINTAFQTISISSCEIVAAHLGQVACRSKTDVAMVNEALCKIICHNICCLIQEAHELGITTEFWANQSTPR